MLYNLRFLKLSRLLLIKKFSEYQIKIYRIYEYDGLVYYVNTQNLVLQEPTNIFPPPGPNATANITATED